MARKKLTKEITFTIVKYFFLDVNEDGSPKPNEQEPIEMLGEISIEKADKIIAKDNKGKLLMVYSAEVIKRTYEMEVEDFIKIARVKTKEENKND